MTPEPISREPFAESAAGQRLTHDARCESGHAGDTYIVNGCDCSLRQLRAALEAGDALAEVLKDLIGSPIEFQDPRVSYMAIQIERADVDAAVAALAAWRAHVEATR